MKELHIYPNRKFFVLKMDNDYDILKIPIPINLAYALGHLVIQASNTTYLDCQVFQSDSELTYKNLFGDYIKNILATDTWKNKNFQIKICSFEDGPR